MKRTLLITLGILIIAGSIAFIGYLSLSEEDAYACDKPDCYYLKSSDP